VEKKRERVQDRETPRELGPLWGTRMDRKMASGLERSWAEETVSEREREMAGLLTMMEKPRETM
jgi:hypothetical protein